MPQSQRLRSKARIEERTERVLIALGQYKLVEYGCQFNQAYKICGYDGFPCRPVHASDVIRKRESTNALKRNRFRICMRVIADEFSLARMR